MRRTKGPPGGMARRLLAAALLLIGILLAVALLDDDIDLGFQRDPVYLPHGDVVFVPRG